MSMLGIWEAARCSVDKVLYGKQLDVAVVKMSVLSVCVTCSLSVYSRTYIARGRPHLIVAQH